MAASLIIGGSLYTAVNGGGDSDWARCYPYEHLEIFSGEPIMEGDSYTCSSGWIMLTTGQPLPNDGCAAMAAQAH